MSRQLEEQSEIRTAKRHRGILEAVEGGLEVAVGRCGGTLTGLAVKGGEGDCLLVIKAVFPGGPQVAFVGGDNLGSSLIKAVREASQDKLRWREDRYGSGT